MLSSFGTLSLDQNTFIAWGSILVEKGFARFYEGWSDYLPGYLYILWLLGKIQSLNIIPTVILYKLPAIISDIFIGLIIYLVVKRIKNEKWALASSALFLFNPAVLGNSTFWGQSDSVTALFALLALFLLDKSLLFSSIFLSLGTLVKPQGGFIAPLLFFLMIKNKWKAGRVVSYILVSLSIFVLGFLPFANGKEIFQFIFERLSVTYNQYPYTSINAFNFWALSGLWQSETVYFFSKYIGLVLTLIVSGIAIFIAFKKEDHKYLSAGIILISSFLFLTRMHERHLLALFPFLSISVGLNPLFIFPYITLSATYIANLLYSYKWITENFLTIFSDTQIKIITAANLLSLVFILVNSFIKTRENIFSNLESLVRSKGSWVEFEKVNIGKRAVILLLSVVILFSLVSRLVFLSSPDKEYFDEVYHVFTARRILNGDPKAWEWWNTPPEGFAYEWTHPPLAKLGMALGMKIFGENSFGWRFPGAILGVGSVIMVFFITKEIFKDDLTGILSSSIFALDGLPLVMSRIGMNDGYFLFFILLALLAFLKNKYFFSSLAFGLALASKWSAIWAIPIFIAAHFAFRKKFKINYFWYLLIPPLIYLSSYIPMFLSGHSGDQFIEVQKQMWWYHTNLKAEHSYSSSWWSWPFLGRPIYLYTSDESAGMVARIYAMGNPIVFWFGLFAIGLMAFQGLIKRNLRVIFIVFSYLTFFVPWALSPRIMFLYHYLPSIPFLAIAGGFILRKYKYFIFPVISLSLVLFTYLYPHLVGMKVPFWLDSSYYWFPSWR